MSVLEVLSEEEAYLYAILSDPSGLDQAEFLWEDEDGPEGRFRAWNFQWPWWRDDSPMQVDRSARSIGKSMSIQVKACSFPLLYPGEEMMITAPELNHLNHVTGYVERRFMDVRLLRELLPKGKSNGITHRPFEMQFTNGARIYGRIPQRDGRGVKGCVGAGTLVLSKDGLVPVEDIEIGDEVWTHEGRWQPVLDVSSYREENPVRVGQGVHSIVMSPTHRIWARRNIASSKQRRDLSEPDWVSVNQEILGSGKYRKGRVHWGSPQDFKGGRFTPKVDFSDSQNTFDMSEDFWWLVGLYLADGWITFQRNEQEQAIRYRVGFAVHPDNHGEVAVRTQRLGLHLGQHERTHSSADVLTISNKGLALWIEDHFGKLADGKKLPAWVLFESEANRKALLEGYTYGDGSYQKDRKRYAVSSASRSLIFGLQLLAQSLGYSTSVSVQPKVDEIMGEKLKSKPMYSWRLSYSHNSRKVVDYGALWSPLRVHEPVEPCELYNIVTEDHSYLGDGIFHHNSHPLRLEMDEAQDYPDAGFVELVETLKRGVEGAQWRAHGVTKGVRDFFYKITQPESNWKVHTIPAMARPTWSDEEKEEKIELYGSTDDPDYRRNIYGLHGDATSPLFVLARLMNCTVQDQSDPYNQKEYVSQRITDEMLSAGSSIGALLDLPKRHLDHESNIFWAGADIGYTNHPTEIVVFRQEYIDGKSVFRLLNRINLTRISHGGQVEAFINIFRFYDPVAFGMDKTGLGLPLFQDIQERAPEYVNKIKGYNFSEKILVDFDSSVELDKYDGDKVKDQGIYRNVLRYASDVLRDLVDNERIVLPWDTDLLGEFQGQTYYVKSSMNVYGKREYSRGSFHALDACRMAMLAARQNPIEEFARKQKERRKPVTDVFL